MRGLMCVLLLLATMQSTLALSQNGDVHVVLFMHNKDSALVELYKTGSVSPDKMLTAVLVNHQNFDAYYTPRYKAEVLDPLFEMQARGRGQSMGSGVESGRTHAALGWTRPHWPGRSFRHVFCSNVRGSNPTGDKDADDPIGHKSRSRLQGRIKSNFLVGGKRTSPELRIKN
jgi:hypothetical protein